MQIINKEEMGNLILKKIERTKRKIKSYEEMTQPIAPENSIGRISRMDAINNKSVAEAGLREAQKVLAGLEYMLANIDNPDFGKCKKCGTDIPVQRMLLVPHSPYCVNCSE
ncbi:MAG TPA: TraR/DksA family transcriptional regulator [Bacteroidetes bacterium]|nr:TraR/DksA family transcriptional regulator [Bacteroidota bacterium]